ncbi:Kinetochore protein mis13 [Cytospora mali]|uniref:Kinetochore protein mis13 n=1 Tax=Cytospora mali TaxID=578113 RepID=A0A194V9G6_CYTMA|nr:Kinetochore protein mis13 [Valsa mali var. pyri (nom. inval.)]
MTTVVRVRQPLHALSMSNQSEPRLRSKRLAVYDEQDGDFLFTRGSKRQKISPKEPPAPAPAPPPAPEPEPVPAVKKPRGRPSRGTKRAASPPHQNGEETPATTSKRPTRRKLNSSPPPSDDTLVVPRKRPTRTTRSSMKGLAEEGQVALPTRTNGARSTNKDDGAKKSGRKTSRKQPPPVEEDVQATPDKVDKPLEKDPHAQKITLPLSDTPINKSNKEFRKKGGAGGGGGRRSSMSMRGRRASSLIENGHSAIPHREVSAAEFYKHIEAEGLSEPRRMKQLLTWCGERALSEKPQHGTAGAPAVLGARAIQDALLKDFGSKSEFSDWFSREDEPSDPGKPKKPVVVKPNPINVEHEQKIAELEERIKRLKEARKSWRALQAPLPQLPPLYPQDGDPKKAPLPESSLLDAEEAKMLDFLTDSSSSFANLKSTTRSRLQAVQSGVEFKVDHLADSVHKMDLRVVTAGKQADKVLALGSGRLREREEKEREAVGTKEMPTMEVLRSLSRILPENGG